MNDKKILDNPVVDNPFPGLRPFEENEEHLFFGREKEVSDMLSRLRNSRFLAVTGTSGSGKSSLVRAGVLPALYRGFMVKAGSHWRVAVLRPGNNPIANLARVLGEAGIGSQIPGDSGDDPESSAVAGRFTETTLRRSHRGLIDVVRQANLPAHHNLLIVVDQFEEIFRFSRLEQESKDGKQDSVAFIKLLLEAGQQEELPIYIILTMRSDFLGDCTVFMGLPEAINKGQYLIPRMTREEKRAAITGPIAVAGGDISSPLLSRLLNDVGDNPDQLPIFQHALMRTWKYWARQRRPGEPMDICHYEAIGAMAQALSQHAEETFAQLHSEKSRLVCEKLFKIITDTGETGRGVRRPARIDEISRAANASKREVIEVIEVFRQPGRTFLMPPHGTALDDDTVIDISHESFMRIWTRLQDWVKEESQSAELYTRLAKTAALHEEGKAGLWRDPELMLTLKWRDENKPNAEWAERYDPSFGRAIGFLEKSQQQQKLEIAEKEREQKAKIKRARIFAVIIGIAALISIAFGIRAFNEKKAADKARAEAVENKEKAERAQGKEKEQREKAEEAQRAAEKLQKKAEEQEKIARASEKKATQAKQEAEANEQKAKENKIKAEIQGLIVDMNKEEANFHQYLAKAKELAVQSLAISSASEKELKARLAFTAYCLNDWAYGYLGKKAGDVVKGFDKKQLNLFPGNQEIHDKYNESTKFYERLSETSQKKIHVREIFQALREALIALDEKSGDILYPNVESWALAVPGQQSVLFNTMDRKLLLGFLPSHDTAAPGNTKKEPVSLPGAPLEVSVLLDTPDRLFGGTGDGRVISWEKSNWKNMKILAQQQGKILALAFSTPKNFLFYSMNNQVYRLNFAYTNGPEAVIRLEKDIFIRTLAVVENSGQTFLIVADSGGHIFMAEVKEGDRGIMEQKLFYKDLKKSSGFYAMAWDPKGKVLALGNASGEILLFPHFNPGTISTGGKKLQPITIEKAHKGIVRVLAFGPGGKYLASGGFDGVTRLWHLGGESVASFAQQEPVLTIPGTGSRKILSLVFAKNGKSTIFCDSHNLRVCPIQPESFYNMLDKKGITILDEREWQDFIGENIARKEFTDHDTQ